MCQIIKFPAANVHNVQPGFFIGQRLFAKFANLNKNNTLEEYRKECAQIGGFSLELCEVEKVAMVSPEEYDEIANSLLSNRDIFSGLGGIDSDSEYKPEGYSFASIEQKEDWFAKSYRLATVVTALGREPFVADPQGSSYARYAGIEIQRERPRIDRPGDLLGCWVCVRGDDSENQPGIIYKVEDISTGSFSGSEFSMQKNKRVWIAKVDAERNVIGNTHTFASDIADPRPHGWRFACNIREYNQLTLSEVAELSLLVAAFEGNRKAEIARETQERIRRRDEFAQEIANRKPSDAKAMIVAECWQDKSDLQTDYHGGSKQKIVFLSWSKSTRDNFGEMRKAARNLAETAHLADGPENFEHREKYSMGHGNYLASKYIYQAGWIVRKIPVEWIYSDCEIFHWNA